MGYDDDDGDDFGLPSLSSMKRRAKRRENQERPDPYGLAPALGGAWNDTRSRRLSNSADIAIERPAPSYPMPKKSEGKILRPQYKEILRGMPRLVAQVHKVVLLTPLFRSCKRTSSN